MTDLAPPPEKTSVGPPAVSPRRLTMASVTQLIGRLIAAVMGALLGAVLARSLGASQFGVYAVITALATIGLQVADSGTTQIGVRDMSARPERRGDVAAALIAGQAGAGLVLAPILFVVSMSLVHGASARWACALFLLALPLAGIGELQAVAQARLRPGIYTTVVLCQSAVWLGSAVVLGSMDAPLPAFAAAFLGSLIIQYLLLIALTRDLVRLRWTRWRTTALNLYKSGLPLGVAGLFVLAYYKIDGVLLFRYKGASASGLYAAGYKFLDAFQFLPATIIGILTPLMSRIAASTSATRWRRDLPRLAFTLLVLSAGIVSVGTILLSGSIVSLLYGPRYAASSGLLAILMLAFPAICLGWLYGTMLITNNRLKPYLTVALVAAFANVALNLVLLPHFGATAAAWLTVATEWFVVASLAVVTSRQLGFTPSLRRTMACLTSLLAAVAAGLATVRYGPLPCGAAIVSTFLLSVSLLRVVPLEELKELFSRKSYLDV